jgi:hypothetical protein
MLHLRLAHMAGCVDVDELADGLTSQQLLEWWAYGCLNGWFVHPESLQKNEMDAAKSFEYFRGLSNGGNNNP